MSLQPETGMHEAGMGLAHGIRWAGYPAMHPSNVEEICKMILKREDVTVSSGMASRESGVNLTASSIVSGDSRPPSE